MYKKNILAIHLNTQIIKGFLTILIILTGLIVSSRLVGYFEQAAVGSLNSDIILSVILLRLPDFLSLLIPFAFFLSLLIVISDLYHSNGIYAYFSAGVSRLQLIKYVAPFFAVTLIFCSLLSIYIAPYTKVLSKNLIAEQSYEDKLLLLEPKTLITLDNQLTYLHFDVYNDQLMEGVTFFVHEAPSLSLIKADALEISNINNEMVLKFTNGSIYPDVNSPNKIKASFKELTHTIEVDAALSNTFNLAKLLDFRQASTFIESQWNASIPMMLAGLLLLSFVFGQSNPRAGREGSLVTGVLIYIFYLSVLVAYRETYPNASDYMYYGLWPVHLLFLVFGGLLFKLDGRVSIQALILSPRLKTIAIIFSIFALLIWLSS
jgi:lipopolysaccharide export system permease protein